LFVQRHQNLSENQAGISVYEVSNNHGFAFGGHNEETRGSDWKEVWGARIHMKLSICMQFRGGQTVHAYCNETKKCHWSYIILFKNVVDQCWQSLKKQIGSAAMGQCATTISYF